MVHSLHCRAGQSLKNIWTNLLYYFSKTASHHSSHDGKGQTAHEWLKIIYRADNQVLLCWFLLDHSCSLAKGCSWFGNLEGFEVSSLEFWCSPPRTCHPPKFSLQSLQVASKAGPLGKWIFQGASWWLSKHGLKLWFHCSLPPLSTCWWLTKLGWRDPPHSSALALYFG